MRRVTFTISVAILTASLSACSTSSGTPVHGLRVYRAVPVVDQSARSQVAPPSAATSGRYLAVTRSGRTEQLRLVSRSTGATIRTLLTAHLGDRDSTILDADLAPDGDTAWVVRAGGDGTYEGVLWRIKGTKSTLVQRYVRSVRLSPDGRKLAVTVLSPDGPDADRAGTQSVRLIDAATLKPTTTLGSWSFPVDRAGLPTVEVGALRVFGWLGSTRLVLGDGCCDSGEVSIVSATAKTALLSRPQFGGDHNTIALSHQGTNVFVTRARWRDTEPEPQGYDVFRITPTNHKGVRVFYYPTRKEAIEVVDALVAKTGATPYVVGSARYPYKGPGAVVAAYL